LRTETSFAVASLLVATLAPPAAAETTVQERLGHPASARLLVIHADDLGMSHSVNRATFEALENGWITSASILVPCPWFPEVARFAKAHPDFDLGIHLALNSEWTTFRWGPLLRPDRVPSLLDDQGYLPLLETAVAQRAKPNEAERELRAQIAHARKSGVRISHLDSHMGALFQTRELLGVYRKLGRETGVPVLLEREGVRGGTRAPWTADAARAALLDRVVSISPGVPSGEWLAAYQQLLSPLPPGAYELIVHLAYDDAEMRGATADHPDWGAAWRQSDFDLVKSPAFREFLNAQGFVLVNWANLARAMAPSGAR
jgi:chitin disaccharide deacetylase